MLINNKNERTITVPNNADEYNVDGHKPAVWKKPDTKEDEPPHGSHL